MGDAAAISAAREACLEHAGGLGGDSAAWIRAHAWQASLVVGVNPEVESVTNDATGPGARAETAMAVIHQLRARGAGQPPEPQATDSVDVAIVILRCQAEALIARGDFAGAEAKVAEALWLSRTHGWALHEVELHCLRGDLLLLTGRSAALVGDDLERSLSTPRFIAEARFLRLVSKAPVPALALTELAEQTASPIAARRAAALLDSSVELVDAVDRAVIRALVARADAPGGPACKSGAPPALVEPIVRLRPVERVAEFSGRSVSLSRNELLWRLLQALAPGVPRSHEELVRVAWDTEYHPLRDDARLRVAIARLRKLLGRAPDSPIILSVAGTGYELRRAR
jgi:DNA-binding response OmpR family regulator